MTPLQTPRLTLRPWQDEDREPFFTMSQDPGLQEFLIPMTTRTATDAWIDRQIAHQTQHGICFWAAETRDTNTVIGSIGLYHVGYEAHFTPAVELGWRLARPFWGQGHAPEAATACLHHAFATLHLPQVVANTAVANTKSRRVMHKLGMTHDPRDDFDHPRFPEHDPLCRQVLYRVRRDSWSAGTNQV